MLLALGLTALLLGPCGPGEAHVPAGPFLMGSDAGERAWAYRVSSPPVREARWFDDELARGRAALPSYCVDLQLVSQRDYQAFVRATGHRVPFISREDYQRQGFLVHGYEAGVTLYLWRQGSAPPALLDHPVVLVSVADAEAYCRWRGERDGVRRRLPSEAEWEKAARGADGRWFPWGSRWDARHLNSAERGPGTTTPVAAYPNGRSPFVLFDAVGNVFQWTATADPDGRQVLKGCAWDDERGLCRPAFRHGRPPSSRHILIGFRCAGPAGE